MKIVILDKATVTNYGDISLDRINKLGDVIAYDFTTKEQIIDRIGDAEGIITNKCVIDSKVMESCNQLKYIGLFATGYNIIDIEEASKRGIVVSNAGAYSTMAVAQHVFSFILNFYSKIDAFNRSVHNGDWQRSELFSYFLENVSPMELFGKNLGILGFGSIGRAVGSIGTAFGMNILVNTRTIPKENNYNYSCEFVDRETLFRDSDILSLHCPLTKETSGIINKNSLSHMKSTAMLINTARGGMVVEEDLAEALKCRKIAAAALDVLNEEPMSKESVLLGLSNCLITPHVAWAPKETRERLVGIVGDCLEGFINGTPKNVVNKRC